jgi:hypothetical protein
MQIHQVIEQAILKPLIPHDPNKHSLKQWAMFVLRDKGFKVVYAQNADFAVEPKGGEKLYFKVGNSIDNLDRKYGWIIWDPTTRVTSVIPPE